MTRVCVMIGLLTLASALLVSTSYSQEKKEVQPPPNVQLPSGWGKIGITPDQKKKIYEVIGNYQGKINSLKDQMEALKKEEYAEAYKLLNDDQKAALKKAAEKGIDVDKDKKDKDKK